MARIQSFSPIENGNACVLILGTMPGAESLRRGQYYANPRNQFWKIAGSLLNFDSSANYSERVAALKNARVALWDVLKSCTRPTSLDSDIDKASAYPNDFEQFFTSHPAIGKVCFNGATAEKLFRKSVRLSPHTFERLQFKRLPSTSSANARSSLDNKKEAWRIIL